VAGTAGFASQGRDAGESDVGVAENEEGATICGGGGKNCASADGCEDENGDGDDAGSGENPWIRDARLQRWTSDLAD